MPFTWTLVPHQNGDGGGKPKSRIREPPKPVTAMVGWLLIPELLAEFARDGPVLCGTMQSMQHVCGASESVPDDSRNLRG